MLSFRREIKHFVIRAFGREDSVVTNNLYCKQLKEQHNSITARPRHREQRKLLVEGLLCYPPRASRG